MIDSFTEKAAFIHHCVYWGGEQMVGGWGVYRGRENRG